jgi:hypothetical protein
MITKQKSTQNQNTVRTEEQAVTGRAQANIKLEELKEGSWKCIMQTAQSVHGKHHILIMKLAMIFYKEEKCWLYYKLRQNLVNYDKTAAPVVIFIFHAKAILI